MAMYIEEAKQMEEQQLKDAIMHALDEDGHTGDWKIKFANEYIKNLKWLKTK
jgi:phosphoribosylformimino-5-aminoimidazole carboxamide ribonucleotide (ProFAR) isomerase